MDASTLINIILCILSFVLAAISVITVVITLRQNSKMIESANRPYIAIYGIGVNFQSPSYYIILKNFGNSYATIENLSCDIDLSACSYDKERVPFSDFNGMSIAPGQSFSSNVKPVELFNATDSITFNVSYSSNVKKYHDSFTINLKADAKLLHKRADTSGKELKIISYTLQDIAEKLL